ncbi:MAG: hypothetical protein ABIQ30_09760 [Devosia sp.]
MFRTVVISAIAATMIAFTAVPVLAGPAETAFLQKLTNTWSGKGKLSGAETGAIACKLVIKGAAKATYQGRCNIPDMAQQAFSGSISYNDKLKRYESRSANGTVAGVRRGDKLVFTTTSKNMGGTSYSTMTIAASSLTVDFAIVDKNGAKTTSRISFTK